MSLTSKEALEKICLHCEHYHQDMCYRAIAGCEEWHKLEKDLEELEELKKIMGTPIQEIMKQLKVLEILKEHYRFNKNINEDLLVLKKPITIEDSEKIREWLNGKEIS